MNRITGFTEILYSSGWKRIIENDEAIPKDEIAKIEIRGDIEGEYYKFVIYNGSNWTIKKIKLSIGAKDVQGRKIWQRIYETTVNVNPFYTGSYSIKLMHYVPKIIRESNAHVKGEDLKNLEAKLKTLTDEDLAIIAGLNPEDRLEGASGYKAD